MGVIFIKRVYDWFCEHQVYSFFLSFFLFFATIMIIFFFAFTLSARDTVKETIANLGSKKRYIWKILKQHN